MAEQKSAERRQRWHLRRNGCWRWVMAELWLQGGGLTPSSYGDTADFVRHGDDRRGFRAELITFFIDSASDRPVLTP